MQKQTKPKPLGIKMAKLVLVVAVIVCLGAVAGVAGWVAINKTVNPSQPTPTLTPTPSQDETADWKTYRNEEFGFEFKYPYESESGDRGFKGESTLINFTIDQDKSGGFGFILTDKVVKEGVLNDNYFGEMLDPELIVVGGRTAYKYQINKYCRGYLVAVPIQTEKTLEISLDDCYIGGATDKNFPDNQVDILNQILSTFRFLTAEEITAVWQTYGNEEYGFEIKYPEDWIIKDVRKSLSFARILIEPSKIITSKPIIDAIVIDIDTASKINTLEDYLDKNILIDPYAEPQKFKKFTELFPNYKIVKVDNTDGIQYESEVAAISTPTQKIITTALLNNKSVIEIIADGEYTDIYNQMLSTFKFIGTENSYIRVNSPNGGEKWVTGETYTISWTSNNVSSVIIVLNQGVSRSFLISSKTGVSASIGKFNWKPENSAFYVGRDDLKIIVRDAAYCGYVDESTGIECVKDELLHGDASDDYFSIEPICSSAEISGYRAVEIKTDLNGDKQEETIRAYQDSKGGCEQTKPVGVKVFSGTTGCLKEVFSSFPKIFSFIPGKFEEGNQLGEIKVLPNFWGDERNAVMVEDISYACGSGSSGILLFLNYQEGKYSIVEGPGLSGTGCLGWKYKFDGDNGAGKKIIVAEPEWGEDYSDYCCGCASRARFRIYTWNGKSYTKTATGVTKNKYSFNESIDEILQKEPSVLNGD